MLKFLASLTIIFSSFSAAFPCEGDSTVQSYPKPTNPIDEEIDALLDQAELSLFSNNFSQAFTYVVEAENLLPLTNDENDYRRLRSLFDKAIIVICIEGPTQNGLENLVQFDTLLASKCCEYATDQPNLFDQNGHWPILGDNTAIKIEECLERVNTTAKVLEIACGVLQVHPAIRMSIASAIYAITLKARNCCTRDGFWKTCIQPVVDSWKRAELFGIPPDPSSN